MQAVLTPSEVDQVGDLVYQQGARIGEPSPCSEMSVFGLFQ